MGDASDNRGRCIIQHLLYLWGLEQINYWESHDGMSSIALDILLCLHLKSKDLPAHVSFANIRFSNIALC